MNYNKLRYFYEVARHESMSEAAKAAGVSVPALSRHVSDLEREFTTDLFRRGKHDLTLTSAGAALRDECARFFEDEDRFRRIVLAGSGMRPGTVRVAAQPSRLSEGLARLARSFEEEFPGISVDISAPEDPRDLWRLVKTRGTDVGLRLSLPIERLLPHVEYATLASSGYVAAVPLGHPLARRHVLRLEDIPTDETLIHEMALAPMRTGLEGYRCIPIRDLTESLEAVAQGKGIGIFCELNCPDEYPGIKLLPLRKQGEVLADLMWREVEPTEEVKAFVERAQAFDWSLPPRPGTFWPQR